MFREAWKFYRENKNEVEAEMEIQLSKIKGNERRYELHNTANCRLQKSAWWLLDAR